ncbi:amino acid kinase family protein [Ramlibacter cellulosilyticus]|uniref:amino acid kinase family protein n=1 Tax=Ramlibacter cellulosilyticus TaxID=2764187 RepID=UPI0021065182|nr:aspartate kinase [Ramlibacter cellulosilyticus]
MWIVKLGGSLAQDPRLVPWLAMLAELGGGRVTVVPGGGRFADAVRASQRHWGFADLPAHNMAVLAMAQTAHLFHALEPRLALAADEAGIRRTLHAGQPALWLPTMLLRDAPDLLTTWEVTSDSLALWLARLLNAERLVLVKACAVAPGSSLAELEAAGVVDARFEAWSQEAPFPIEVVACDALEGVRDALLGETAGSLPLALAAAAALRTRGQRGVRVRRKRAP